MLAELYFNLPVFSAILLLIAGVLLGYALWFPYRGDAESITQRLNELRAQNDELQASLRQDRQAYASLEQKYAAQCDELTALQASSQRVESALKKHDAVRSDLSSGVATMKELKASAMKQLEVERQARLDLEVQLRDARAQNLQATQKVEQTKTALEMELADRREQCEAIAEALQQSRTAQLAATNELESARQELAQLQAKQQDRQQLEVQLQDSNQLAGQLRSQTEDYHHLSSKYELLVEQLEAAKVASEALTRERDQLRDAIQEKQESLLAAENMITNTITSHDAVEEKLVTLQSELANQRQQYQALASDRDDIAEQLSQQQEQNLELQSRIQEQTNELAERREAAEAVAEIRDQLSSVQIEWEQARAQLQRTTTERDDAIAACEEAQAELAAAAGTAAALRLDLAHHQRAIETIERHRSKTQSSLTSQANRHHELEQQIRQQEHTIETLREELAELATLRQQCVSLQTTIQDQTAQLKATRLDRDEIAAELADGKNKWQNVEQRLAAYQHDLDRIREQREGLLEQVSDEKARNQDLSNAISEQSRRLESLGQNLSQLDPLKDEIVSLRSQLETQQQRSSELIAGREAAQRDAMEANEALAEARNELSETWQSMIALERDRDEVLGRLRRQNVMLESHLAQASQNEQAPDGELQQDEVAQLTRRDERRGLVYTSAPAEVDDLKRISGVAHVLEQRLNEFGIYTYKQIMEWDPVVVAEFSKILAFRDRIQRDDWIGQATALYQDKYGRAA